MTVARCAEPDCLRLLWRDGLCWWCAQAALEGYLHRQIPLDVSRDSKAPLSPMTGDDEP